MAPVPKPIRAKPATLAAKPALAATIANPAAASAKDPTMMRWSETLSRIIRVEAERRLADGKERRAEARDRRESGRLRAQEECRPQQGRRFGGDRNADDDPEPDQGRGERKAARGRRRRRARRVPLGAGSAVIGEAGGAEADCGEEPGRPGRLACDDQAAEDGAGRHAGGGGSVQAGEDRPAETALDPRAFGVHRDVDDAADEAGGDKRAGDRDA